MPKHDDFKPISDYGVIGNTRTVALIDREGAIDWFCAPNFDSPPCFYPLLDPNEGGYCRLEAPGLLALGRRYVGDTAVLENTFATNKGNFTLTDFMPVIKDGFAGPTTGVAQIARIVRCTEGEVSFKFAIWPAKGFVHAHAGSDPVLANDMSRYALPDRELTVEALGAKLSVQGRETTISGHLKQGECAEVLLSFSQPDDLTRRDIEDVLWHEKRTLKFWNKWSKGLTYDGNYREQVIRSAITLKLCQFSPTGAIIAAPTTSLPERVGGEYNWDYRFTWLRDSTFTIVALLSLGAVDEAMEFLKFLHATTLRLQDFLTLFTIFGQKPLGELNLKRLRGYRESRPVRVGNAAMHQLQLDIYGELIYCIDLLLSHTELKEGRFSFERDLWPMITQALDDVCSKWQQPDRGIWETRNAPRHFVYSQGMCWIALHRGIGIAERFQKKVADRWRKTCDEIHADFHAKAYSEEKKSYVQAYGHDDLDASVLRLILLGMLDTKTERVRNTLQAIKSELTVDGFVLRNKNLDAAKVGEGAFLPCTFWYADCEALSENLEEARHSFERLLKCGNDLGLFSEEFDPTTGTMLGNFPQAFTHVALINSAVQLAISCRGHYSESHNILRSGDGAEKAA
ncbi:MAG TPA: glycoside hydrolase family 15 protein [Terriglobales bacterium]